MTCLIGHGSPTLVGMTVGRGCGGVGCRDRRGGPHDAGGRGRWLCGRAARLAPGPPLIEVPRWHRRPIPPVGVPGRGAPLKCRGQGDDSEPHGVSDVNPHGDPAALTRHPARHRRCHSAEPGLESCAASPVATTRCKSARFFHRTRRPPESRSSRLKSAAPARGPPAAHRSGTTRSPVFPVRALKNEKETACESAVVLAGQPFG